MRPLKIWAFLLADALTAAQLHGFDEFLVDVGEHFPKWLAARVFSGVKGWPMPLLLPAVFRRRLMPTLSIRPVKSKPPPITPMLPTMLEGSA